MSVQSIGWDHENNTWEGLHIATTPSIITLEWAGVCPADQRAHLLLVDLDNESLEVVEAGADLACSELLGPCGLSPLGCDVLLLPDLK